MAFQSTSGRGSSLLVRAQWKRYVLLFVASQEGFEPKFLRGEAIFHNVINYIEANFWLSTLFGRVLPPNPAWFRREGYQRAIRNCDMEHACVRGGTRPILQTRLVDEGLFPAQECPAGVATLQEDPQCRLRGARARVPATKT